MTNAPTPPTALDLALEALREDRRALVDGHAHPDTGVIPPDEPEARTALDRYCAAINGLEALRAALASPAPAAPAEPVAWMGSGGTIWLTERTAKRHDLDAKPLYLHKPAEAPAQPAGDVGAVPADEQRPTRADLIAALQFYADGMHFQVHNANPWDTVSGEPQNWWCDEAGTATVEDGHIAKATLAGELTADQINADD